MSTGATPESTNSVPRLCGRGCGKPPHAGKCSKPSPTSGAANDSSAGTTKATASSTQKRRPANVGPRYQVTGLPSEPATSRSVWERSRVDPYGRPVGPEEVWSGDPETAQVVVQSLKRAFFPDTSPASPEDTQHQRPQQSLPPSLSEERALRLFHKYDSDLDLCVHRLTSIIGGGVQGVRYAHLLSKKPAPTRSPAAQRRSSQAAAALTAADAEGTPSNKPPGQPTKGVKPPSRPPNTANSTAASAAIVDPTTWMRWSRDTMKLLKSGNLITFSELVALEVQGKDLLKSTGGVNLTEKTLGYMNQVHAALDAIRSRVRRVRFGVVQCHDACSGTNPVALAQFDAQLENLRAVPVHIDELKYFERMSRVAHEWYDDTIKVLDHNRKSLSRKSVNLPVESVAQEQTNSARSSSRRSRARSKPRPGKNGNFGSSSASDRNQVPLLSGSVVRDLLRTARDIPFDIRARHHSLSKLQARLDLLAVEVKDLALPDPLLHDPYDNASSKPSIDRIESVLEKVFREGFAPDGTSTLQNSLRAAKAWIASSSPACTQKLRVKHVREMIAAADKIGVDLSAHQRRLNELVDKAQGWLARVHEVLPSLHSIRHKPTRQTVMGAVPSVAVTKPTLKQLDTLLAEEAHMPVDLASKRSKKTQAVFDAADTARDWLENFQLVVQEQISVDSDGETAASVVAKIMKEAQNLLVDAEDIPVEIPESREIFMNLKLREWSVKSDALLRSTEQQTDSATSTKLNVDECQAMVTELNGLLREACSNSRERSIKKSEVSGATRLIKIVSDFTRWQKRCNQLLASSRISSIEDWEAVINDGHQLPVDVCKPIAKLVSRVEAAKVWLAKASALVQPRSSGPSNDSPVTETPKVGVWTLKQLKNLLRSSSAVASDANRVYDQVSHVVDMLAAWTASTKAVLDTKCTAKVGQERWSKDHIQELIEQGSVFNAKFPFVDITKSFSTLKERNEAWELWCADASRSLAVIQSGLAPTQENAGAAQPRKGVVEGDGAFVLSAFVSTSAGDLERHRISIPQEQLVSFSLQSLRRQLEGLVAGKRLATDPAHASDSLLLHVSNSKRNSCDFRLLGSAGYEWEKKLWETTIHASPSVIVIAVEHLGQAASDLHGTLQGADSAASAICNSLGLWAVLRRVKTVSDIVRDQLKEVHPTRYLCVESKELHQLQVLDESLRWSATAGALFRDALSMVRFRVSNDTSAVSAEASTDLKTARQVKADAPELALSNSGDALLAALPVILQTELQAADEVLEAQYKLLQLKSKVARERVVSVYAKQLQCSLSLKENMVLRTEIAKNDAFLGRVAAVLHAPAGAPKASAEIAQTLLNDVSMSRISVPEIAAVRAAWKAYRDWEKRARALITSVNGTSTTSRNKKRRRQKQDANGEGSSNKNKKRNAKAADLSADTPTVKKPRGASRGPFFFQQVRSLIDEGNSLLLNADVYLSKLDVLLTDAGVCETPPPSGLQTCELCKVHYDRASFGLPEVDNSVAASQRICLRCTMRKDMEDIYSRVTRAGHLSVFRIRADASKSDNHSAVQRAALRAAFERMKASGVFDAAQPGSDAQLGASAESPHRDLKLATATNNDIGAAIVSGVPSEVEAFISAGTAWLRTLWQLLEPVGGTAAYNTQQHHDTARSLLQSGFASPSNSMFAPFVAVLRHAQWFQKVPPLLRPNVPEKEFAAVVESCPPAVADCRTIKALRAVLTRDRAFVADAEHRFLYDETLVLSEDSSAGLNALLRQCGRVWVDCGVTDLRHKIQSAIGDGGNRHCVCRRFHDGTAREFVQCASCDAWFHFECVGWNGSDDDDFHCGSCLQSELTKKAQNPPSTPEEATALSQLKSKAEAQAVVENRARVRSLEPKARTKALSHQRNASSSKAADEKQNVVPPTTTATTQTKQAQEQAISAGVQMMALEHARVKAAAEAEVQERLRKMAQAHARAKAQAEAEAEAEVRTKLNKMAEAHAKAKAQAKAEAEAVAEAVAQARVRKMAEAHAQAKAKAEAEAEAEVRMKLNKMAEAHAKAKAEAEAQAEAEIREKLKKMAEAHALAKAMARAQLDAETAE